MPFKQCSGDSYSYNVEQTLGGADFRALNAEYTEKSGTVSRVTESLFPVGGYSDTDRVLVLASAGSVNDTRSIYDALKAKATAKKIEKSIIKGDSESNPLEFDGFQARCTGNQLVSAGSTSGGDNLELNVLDAAIDKCSGTPDNIIMNRTMARRMSVGARLTSVSGDLNYSIDQFGKRVTRYNGIEILTVDVDEDYNDILAFDEASANGGSSVCTSIYVVRWGEIDGTCGLMLGDVAAEDLGIKNNVSYRTLIEAIMGIAVFDPRSLVRFYGITDTAITA